MHRILTEASGSLTAAYLIKAIKEAGHNAVASDIDENCYGRYLADGFMLMPHKDDADLWGRVDGALSEHRIDIVIPSLDETLSGWAERKGYYKGNGIDVIVSDVKTVALFQDKWETYLFFRDNEIPAPETSLEQKYPLVKPRFGRGAAGVRVESGPVKMEGMVSQELLDGEEFTVDVFCDRDSKPVYIVPRNRMGVKEGKSTGGKVVDNAGIIRLVRRICGLARFIGPVNIQCFLCRDGKVRFTEVNTRIAGGMALGFAATENWIRLIVEHLVEGRDIIPKPVRYGMEMRRYYAEVFIP